MRGYGGFEEFISARGGIVSRKELLDAGWTPDELRIAQGNYRRPTRLRRGWYCSSDVPSVVRLAWAHGGPLACVSALRWYGMLPAVPAEPTDPADPTGPADTAVHVCLPRHAQRRRVEAHGPVRVVLHWHDAVSLTASRWAVPPDVALEQARWCRSALREGDS